jgi:Polyketide cyclase / dehydrase and lipid transport
MTEYFSAAQPVAASADRIWAILADFSNQELVKGFCRAVHVTGSGRGAVRTFELFDDVGGGAVSERIEEIDREARYYSYRVFDIGPLPFADYVGSFRIAAAGPTRSVVIYHAEFLPVGDASASLGLEMVRHNFDFVMARLRDMCSTDATPGANT